ncbi:hypothetical protein O6H91_02G095500 [Diphasiastrum complanatum]|uniref:Uncharacterized protein n=1 Tax=Diphasiastrum complanatum TaxID=34168 RepID=A0ACC2EIH4_DIPCM|nr:hypothetical protein O6H91_02G095500 [Diphasiastrum complanatum]
MPRNRSSGRSTPRMAPRPPARPAPPPQPVNHAPPPAPLQSSGSGSMMGGLASTIAQGVAFGTGSAVAHRAVDSIMGPRVVQHEQIPANSSESQTASAAITPVGGADACTYQAKAFQDCLNASGSDISKCQFYMDMLADCRRGSSASVTL